MSKIYLRSENTPHSTSLRLILTLPLPIYYHLQPTGLVFHFDLFVNISTPIRAAEISSAAQMKWCLPIQKATSDGIFYSVFSHRKVCGNCNCFQGWLVMISSFLHKLPFLAKHFSLLPSHHQHFRYYDPVLKRRYVRQRIHCFQQMVYFCAL